MRRCLALVLSLLLLGLVPTGSAAAAERTLVLGGSDFGRQASLVDANDDWLLYRTLDDLHWVQSTHLDEPARRLPSHDHGAFFALAGDHVVSYDQPSSIAPDRPLVVVDLGDDDLSVRTHGRHGGAWEQARDGSIVFACDYPADPDRADDRRPVTFCRVDADGRELGRWEWAFTTRGVAHAETLVTDIFLTDDLIWFVDGWGIHVGSTTHDEVGLAATTGSALDAVAAVPLLVGDWRGGALEWVVPQYEDGSSLLRFTAPSFPCGDACDFDATSSDIARTDGMDAVNGIGFLTRMLDRTAAGGPWVFAHDDGNGAPYGSIRIDADGSMTAVPDTYDPTGAPSVTSRSARFDGGRGQDWWASARDGGTSPIAADVTAPSASPPVVGQSASGTLDLSWDMPGDVFATVTRDGVPVSTGQHARAMDAPPPGDHTYAVTLEDRRGNVSRPASFEVTIGSDGLLVTPTDPGPGPEPTDPAPPDPAPQPGDPEPDPGRPGQGDEPRFVAPPKRDDAILPPRPRTSLPPRLSGSSRYDTAAAIARHQFPDRASTVFLARADDVVDAVAGGVLTDGPLLLVPTDGRLPTSVVEALRALQPERVVALGGTGAVSDATIERAIAVAGGATGHRLAGPSRYATAAAIARWQFAGTVERVYVARADDVVDAVAGGALADGPVLLVPQCDDLPDEVDVALRAFGPDVVVALGGGSAVCDATLESARSSAAADRVDRLSGGSRYATALRIAQHAAPTPDAVFLARADQVVDAVAGGVLTQGPIVLVPSSGEVPAPILGAMATMRPEHVVALGGRLAIGDDVRDAVVAATGAG